MKTAIRRVAVALALVGAAGCGSADHAGRPEDVKDVAILYANNCAGCHGPDGRFGVAQPLNDSTYLALVTDAQLEDIIARGVPGTPMPAFAQAAGGDLTAAQVRILAEGLRTTWRTAPASGPLPRYRADDAAGDPARGREVFQSYCARCHGDDGAGGARGGSVVDEAFLSLTSDQALRTTIIAGRSDLGTPGWKDYAPGAAIDDQQISDVVAWLTSHRGHHE
jgi:mono/diheme cytochrome c family protein